MKCPQLTILIPAAGASKRLGQAKQLVRYNTGTLIQNAINTAHSLSPGEIIVVTGAHEEAVRKAAQGEFVHWVHNPHWSTGMGSSIATGAAAISPRSTAVMIFLCDQWRLQTPDLLMMVKAWVAGPGRIVCAKVNGINMPPVIFPASLFGRLAALHGDKGAKSLIDDNPGMITPISLENAAWDVDLDSHLEQLDSTEL